MKRILMIGIAVAVVIWSIVLSPTVSACEKCKGGDSCGDGCLLPDGARTN